MYKTGEVDRILGDGNMRGVSIYNFLFCNPVLYNYVCVSGIWCIYVVRWRIDIFLGVGFYFFT